MQKIFIILILFSRILLADDPSMNQIRLLDYGDFTQKWKLVTVRYRQDSKEMRFTYANQIAWDAIRQGTAVYPDGSVFAKVGFKSEVDHAFSSSIVPSGARRFQLMVKNSKKYTDTDGWGYALFQSNGDLFEGDVKTVTQSCHACHKLVPERDFVFSEPIEVSPLVKEAQSVFKSQKNNSPIRFSKLEKKDFSPFLISQIVALESVEIIDGSIREYYFGGTLDEVTPLLIDHVLKTKAAAGFVSLDQKTFKIIEREKKSKLCSESEYSFRIYEYRSDWKDTKKAKITNLCYAIKNL